MMNQQKARGLCEAGQNVLWKRNGEKRKQEESLSTNEGGEEEAILYGETPYYL